MKKIDWIFIALIVLELLFVIFTVLTPNTCGSACDERAEHQSFLNPFGAYERNASNSGIPQCIMVCVVRPNPLFYFSVDLLAITLIAYALYLAKRKFVK